MTDTGAVFRAVTIGYPDKIIAETLGITTSTLTLLKKEFEEIKRIHAQGVPWYEAADQLMKDKGEVYYAYHCLESSKEDLEAEAVAEKDGTARLETPEVPKSQGEEEPPEKTGKPGRPKAAKMPKRKDVKEVKKDKIDEALHEEAEKGSGRALMEDAGNAGTEIALARQEIGMYVIDTMDMAAREFGYEKDLKAFLGAIYQFFIENHDTIEQKDEQIRQLNESINRLIEALDDRNRKAFISKVIDAHVFETMRRDMPIKPENLLAYSQYLESFLKPISTENLLKLQPGETLNGTKATQ
ncbi:MAG: hypothetical protein PHZ02_01265 [Desulfocapsaceae bacterium]|nr:hypothetical protein [Desulfocapsaceae bacterium]